MKPKREKTDRILKSISAKNSIEYYTNDKNIPRQELVSETIAYFEAGPGSRVFKPLAFLNLLEKQYHFVEYNWDDKNIVIKGLKDLPLNDLQRHILFGFILKWFGGYPVQDFDDAHKATKKAIEYEFLSYPEETPEKEFCKADNERRKDLMKIEIALNANLNYGVDSMDVLKELGGLKSKQKEYSSFKQLFDDALLNNALEGLENKEEIKDTLKYANTQSRYLFLFNIWLQENKGWEFGDVVEHKKFLTKETFLMFIEHQLKIRRKLIAENETEAASWRIRLTQLPETEESSEDPILISEIVNHFDSVNINEVHKHFKAGLVDKNYLSETDLLAYLYAAFNKMKPPGNRFKLADVHNRQKIIRVFNSYYKDVAGKPHGKQKQYAALLGDYFRGYTTQNVSTNFSK